MPASDGRASDAARFLIAGGINTALTSMVYFAALFALSPTLSYALAWAVGIAFVMIVYPDRVFVGGRRTTRARLTLGALSVGVFLVGVLTLRGLVGFTGDARMAFILTLILTTVLNFVGGRTLLRKEAR